MHEYVRHEQFALTKETRVYRKVKQFSYIGIIIFHYVHPDSNLAQTTLTVLLYAHQLYNRDACGERGLLNDSAYFCRCGITGSVSVVRRI